MPRERIISGQSSGEEENRFNYALRPQTFREYIGQENLIRKLKIAVDAANGRKEPVEHILLDGPPGLGKTTLAHVIANEVKAQVHVERGAGADQAGGSGGDSDEARPAGMCCSSMRFIGCPASWRNICIRRWKISRWR